MDNYELGKKLKKKAKAQGNFVKVSINNVYNLTDTLATFFYKKHHEWIAVCFLTPNFVCNEIWFNKGSSHRHVTLYLQPEDIARKASQLNSKYLLVAHNHPISSKDMPEYGSRLANIRASYQRKEELFGFSEEDEISFDYYAVSLSETGLYYAEAVFVAGTYEIWGADPIVDNFEVHQNRQERIMSRDTSEPKSTQQAECFIVTLCYGKGSREYKETITFRDQVLSKSRWGRLFISIYYRTSPWLVWTIGRSKILTSVSKRLVGMVLQLVRGRSSYLDPEGRAE